MELDAFVTLAMNMADILEKKGIYTDFKKLEEESGISIVRISAKMGENWRPYFLNSRKRIPQKPKKEGKRNSKEKTTISIREIKGFAIADVLNF